MGWSWLIWKLKQSETLALTGKVLLLQLDTRDGVLWEI